jgi:hypothetical protein
MTLATGLKTEQHFLSADTIEAINGDANYPRVVRLVMPPHEGDAETKAAVDRYRQAFKRYQDYCGVPYEP